MELGSIGLNGFWVFLPNQSWLLCCSPKDISTKLAGLLYRNDETCTNISDGDSDPFTEEAIPLPALVAAEQKNLFQTTGQEATSTSCKVLSLQERRRGWRQSTCSLHRVLVACSEPFSFWETTGLLLGLSKASRLPYGPSRHHVIHWLVSRLPS